MGAATGAGRAGTAIQRDCCVGLGTEGKRATPALVTQRGRPFGVVTEDPGALDSRLLILVTIAGAAGRSVCSYATGEVLVDSLSLSCSKRRSSAEVRAACLMPRPVSTNRIAAPAKEAIAPQIITVPMVPNA